MEQNTSIKTADHLNLWFDEFVATLRTHQVQLETKTAPKNLKDFYESIFGGNVEELLYTSQKKSQEFFVKKMIIHYLEELNNDVPKKLAFDINDSEVLIWAEVEEDDEKLERKLIMAEATVNAKYHDFGYAMNSTIVAAEDGLSIPKQYKIFQG